MNVLRLFQILFFAAACAGLVYSQRFDGGGLETERRLTAHEGQLMAQAGRIASIEGMQIEKRIATIEARLDALDWLLKANLGGTMAVGTGQLASWLQRGRKRRKDDDEEESE